MHQDLEQLKQRFPLLDYLQRCSWKPHRVEAQDEFVGVCPLHQETRSSFYVNARKNLFYCHGCGRGGDLIRFVELSQGLSFRESIAYLQRRISPPDRRDLLEQTVAFYRLELHRHREALQYLQPRGVHDPAIIQALGLGYAPGGNLLRHLAAQGYSFSLLHETGLLNSQGADTFCRRIIFPCHQQSRIVNLYGRSIDDASPHRLLPGSKGDLFAWHSVRQFSTLILVEGLFDLAVLWQAGFRNTTSAYGAHLTTAQLQQLLQWQGRCLYIAFDEDGNQAGQQAARTLAQRFHAADGTALIVRLPAGHDPNSFFTAGAAAADFAACLRAAQPL